MSFPKDHDDPDMRTLRVMAAQLEDRINKCVETNRSSKAHAYKLKWDLEYMARIVEKWIYGDSDNYPSR